MLVTDNNEHNEAALQLVNKQYIHEAQPNDNKAT